MHEDLVNRLRELHPEEFSNSWWDFAFACQQAMHEAADAIEELSAIREEQKAQIIAMAAEDKPRWIPVTERKPKTDDIVIVAIHDDSGDTPYDVTNVGFYLDVFPLGIWVVEDERCNYVTHWMPLPEPPKEET